MKKLMVVLAAIAMAVGAQAATVQWKTGTGIKPDGTTAASGTLNMYVWILDKADYDATSMDSIWTTYGNEVISNIKDFDASVTGKGGSMSSTASKTVTAPASGVDYYYGIVIGTWDKDKDGTVDMYVVNKVVAGVNSAGTATDGAGALRFVEGGTSGTAVTWNEVQNIPEPTSGLLLVLGMAGLALRRRRA